jgi:beta-glucosidase
MTATGGSRDVGRLVDDLTLDEKASITTGATMWSTHAIERLGIPSVVVTDGPAGARGPFTPGLGHQVATLCVPCGSALGATFDTALLEEVGRAIGHQTRTKTARVLLAPTVNLHRSPLFGRSFECYSEEPFLSGKLAAAYIRGVQSEGVATTVKHFVGNDAEFERMTINSVIDERTLREVYLLPFELAVREGGSLGIMTSYNRMNGLYCAENKWLLDDLLRGEWGFEGFVVTDWFAGFTTEGAAEAGLDLEMPAPPRAYGKHLGDAVREGRVDESRLDRAVHRLLEVFDRIGALDDPPTEPAAIDLEEHRAIARRAASGSMVLLRNSPIGRKGPLLPLVTKPLRSVAVIGPNAERTRIMGGGSAEVQPHRRTPIIEALRQRLGDKVRVRYEQGCSVDRSTPIIEGDTIVSPSGRPGFDVVVTDRSTDQVLGELHRPDGRVMVVARQDKGIPVSGFKMRAVGHLVVERDGEYLISLSETSPCRLFIDGELIVDGATEIPPPGHRFFGLIRQEIGATVNLRRAARHELVLECDAMERQWAHGAQIGLQYIEKDDPVRRAADLASECDIALVVVGTTDEWESEGHDRTTLQLPGRQDELIREVVRANPRTVVLVNTGAPVDMPWADDVPAILQVWFGGQEMGTAVADVLFGDSDPGGRLPTTIPMRLEHTPAFGNFPGEHGQVRYGEGLLIGHRWYESRHLPVRYPFGHGLSYTTFHVGEPDLDRFEMTGRDTLTVRVPVTNTGTRSGSHVVQIYVAPLGSTIFRPRQELKAFVKVHLHPGESTEAVFELGPRSFAHWDPGDVYRSYLQPQVTGERSSMTDKAPGSWRVEPGLYEIRVASSSVLVESTSIITILEDD